MMNNRRVVTGLNAEGKSCVLIDGPIPQLNPNTPAALAWRCAIPADNSGSDDVVAPYAVEMLHSGDALFATCEFPPGLQAYMHATDTIDFLVILSGSVTLVLEDGEVLLEAGDFVVDRGNFHGWRNDGAEPCRAAVVNIPSRPVGGGRTI